MLKYISLILNGTITIAVIVLILLSFIFYFSKWTEERITKITQLLQLFSVILLFLSSLLFFSSYNIHTAFVSTISNFFWVFLLFTGFPFIHVTRPAFLISIASTAFNHLSWMLTFLKKDSSAFFAISVFLVYIWFLPICAVSSLSAVDSDTQTQRRSAWTNVFNNIQKKVAPYLPHQSNKFE